jgi:hypothetical protein
MLWFGKQATTGCTAATIETPERCGTSGSEITLYNYVKINYPIDGFQRNFSKLAQYHRSVD